MPRRPPKAATEDCTTDKNKDGAVAGITSDLLEIIQQAIPDFKGKKKQHLAVEVAARIYKILKPDSLDVPDEKSKTIFQVPCPKGKEFVMRNGQLLHLNTERIVNEALQKREDDKKHKLCNNGCCLAKARNLTEKGDDTPE